MLPGLAQLETTPKILRLLFEGLSPDEAEWKPSPKRWSIAEVVEHLSHTEAHGFRSRIDRMVEETVPELEDYDQEKFYAAGQYSGRNIEDSFDHWEDQRETNLEYLRSLPDSVSAREGRHARLGTITIGDLLNEWAFHDLGHVRQIIELIRARRYYPQIGVYQSLYRVNP